MDMASIGDSKEKTNILPIIYTAEIFFVNYFILNFISTLILTKININTPLVSDIITVSLAGYLTKMRIKSLVKRGLVKGESLKLAFLCTLVAFFISSLITPVILVSLIEGSGYFEYLKWIIFNRYFAIMILSILFIEVFIFLILYGVFRDKKMKYPIDKEEQEVYGLDVQPVILSRRTMLFSHLKIGLIILITVLSFFYGRLFDKVRPPITKEDVSNNIKLLSLKLPIKVDDKFEITLIRQHGNTINYIIQALDTKKGNDFSGYIKKNTKEASEFLRKNLLGKGDVVYFLKYGFEVKYIILNKNKKQLLTLFFKKEDLKKKPVNDVKTENT